ncbi:MFS transporter [Alienimonas sp. DA493]|uniref:MFS transporter n=1 Tax=Alienimonas sp. DA493 TaxID=3373605 RepID=UPI00375416E0
MPPSDSPPPPLTQDRSFWGMLVTQLLGAFNDNLFKQLVLLICLDYKLASGDDRQGAALAIFAVPFVLFSGISGWLADRWPKRAVVVGCKVLEILVMLLGAAAFWAGGDSLGRMLALLFGVLALMSVQSAIFGPSKYGILPELFRGEDLPKVNGLVQMTTFLAIIFGTVAAGLLKEAFATGLAADVAAGEPAALARFEGLGQLGGEALAELRASLGEALAEGLGPLWKVSLVCVGIAIAGTIASLFIRRTPIAEPGLPFDVSSLVIHRSLWGVLKSDRTLTGALLVSSLFWLAGGLVQPAVNALGKVQLGGGETLPSFLNACVGFGIAAGCVLAGRLSRGRVRFGLVRIGAAGVFAAGLGVSAVIWAGVPGPVALPDALGGWTLEAWPLWPLMFVLGLAAGLFAVPLQVFLQIRPPEALKGRMIGAMNFCNWIGIVASAGLYAALAGVVDGSQPPAAPGLPDPDARYHLAVLAAGIILLPVAFLYRPSIQKDPAAETAAGPDGEPAE